MYKKPSEIDINSGYNHLWISKENVTVGDDLNVKEAWSIKLLCWYVFWPELTI